MVGVPKRTKRCDECRRRRIQCDFGTPACSNCRPNDRACHYANAFTFITNKPGSHKVTYKKRTDSNEIPSRHYCSDESVSGNQIKATKHQRQIPAQFTTHPDALSQICLTTIHSSAIFTQQFAAYAVGDLNSRRIRDASLVHAWVISLQTFTDFPDGIQAPFLACYASWLARTQPNHAMLTVGRQLYIHGMKAVREALRDPQLILKDEVLAACAAMAMYEATDCPDQTRAAFKLHRDAMIRLVWLRGARAHQRGVAHEVFLSIRPHGIFTALEATEPNFLCTKEWIEVPWEHVSKNTIHRLVDILGRGPQIAKDARILRTLDSADVLSALFKLLTDLLQIEADLQTFSQKYLVDSNDPLFWAASSLDHGVQDSFIDTPSFIDSENSFSFRDGEALRLMTVFWAVSAIVWSGLEAIHIGLEGYKALALVPNIPGSERFLELAHRSMWLVMVRNVCRSIDFALALAETGPQLPSIGLSLEIIIDIMGYKTGCLAELQRARRARDAIGQRWFKILISR